MRDFDKLRHGDISKDNFRLALNMAKIPLSESEFQLILDHFQSPQKKNFILWKQFVKVIDEVFNQHELEKVPPNQTLGLAGTDFTYARPKATDDDIRIAQQII